MFTSDDHRQSSAFRELKEIYYVLLFCVEQLKQEMVKVFTDNQGAARIVSVGSSSPAPVSCYEYFFYFSNEITLEAQWIPMSQNERADLLSRFIDKDDSVVRQSFSFPPP